MRSFTVSVNCNGLTDYDRRRCEPHIYNNTSFAMGERCKDAIFADSWISPAGYQYIVGMCGHQHVAQFHSNWEKTEERDYAGDAFEKNGWVHFGLDYDCPVVEYNNKVQPTQAQLDTLFDILMDAKANTDLTFGRAADQVKELERWFNNHQAQ